LPEASAVNQALNLRSALPAPSITSPDSVIRCRTGLMPAFPACQPGVVLVKVSVLGSAARDEPCSYMGSTREQP